MVYIIANTFSPCLVIGDDKERGAFFRKGAYYKCQLSLVYGRKSRHSQWIISSF